VSETELAGSAPAWKLLLTYASSIEEAEVYQLTEDTRGTIYVNYEVRDNPANFKQLNEHGRETADYMRFLLRTDPRLKYWFNGQPTTYFPQPMTPGPMQPFIPLTPLIPGQRHPTNALFCTEAQSDKCEGEPKAQCETMWPCCHWVMDGRHGECASMVDIAFKLSKTHVQCKNINEAEKCLENQHCVWKDGKNLDGNSCMLANSAFDAFKNDFAIQNNTIADLFSQWKIVILLISTAIFAAIAYALLSRMNVNVKIRSWFYRSRSRGSDTFLE